MCHQGQNKFFRRRMKIRKRKKGRNNNLLQTIQEHRSTKLNEDIEFHYVKDTFRMSCLVTLDTFSRPIHIKLIHNRTMANLADSSACLFRNREEAVIYAFLECGNAARFWRSIEGWIRGMIDRHFKLSDVDKIFSIVPLNITINTVILATQETIYSNRQIGGTLALAQVGRKLYNQMVI